MLCCGAAQILRRDERTPLRAWRGIVTSIFKITSSLMSEPVEALHIQLKSSYNIPSWGRHRLENLFPPPRDTPDSVGLSTALPNAGTLQACQAQLSATEYKFSQKKYDINILLCCDRRGWKGSIVYQRNLGPSLQNTLRVFLFQQNATFHPQLKH